MAGTDAWSDLREGAIRKFCFVEVDLAGHSLIAANNSTRDAEDTFSNFLDFIIESAESHSGRPWGIAGDGGLFAFYDDDVTTMAEEATKSALEIIDNLDGFNETKSKVKEEVRARIAVHLGDAKYREQTGRIQSDDINFVAHLEKAKTKPNSVSISSGVYRELVQDELRSRFRDNGIFEERSVYTSAPPSEEDEAEAPAPEPESKPADEPGAPLTLAEIKDRYALVIGISDYSDESIPKLKYAAQDAQAVHDTLIQYSDFKEENIKLLLNEQATYREIKSALGTFLPRNAEENDSVFIYFAGHGCPDVDHSGHNTEDNIAKYLAPYDAVRDDLYATAFPLDDMSAMLQRIASKYVVLALDTCYSGQAGNGRTFETVNTRAVLNNAFLNRMAGEGRVILTASDVNELSMELDQFGHGIFTHHLLAGLTGEADLDNDGTVSLQELYEYVSERVTRDAMSAGGRQHPLLRGSMPLRLPLTMAQFSKPEAKVIDPVSRDLEEALRLQSFGQFDEAVELLSGVLPNAGDRAPEVMRAIAKTRLLKGDVEGALSEYLRAIEADPLSAVNHADYSGALLKAGDYVAAIEALRRAVKIDPELRDHGVLIEMDLEAKIRENPSDWKLRFALAGTMVLQGNLEASVEQIQRASDAVTDEDLDAMANDFAENPAFTDLRATPKASEALTLLKSRQEALEGFRACLKEGEQLRKDGKVAAARKRFAEGAQKWPRYQEVLSKKAAEVAAVEETLKQSNLDRLTKEPYLDDLVEKTLSAKDRSKAGAGDREATMNKARLEESLTSSGYLPIDMDSAFKLFLKRYIVRSEKVVAEKAEHAKRLIQADFLDRAKDVVDTILSINPSHPMGKALAQRLSTLRHQQAESTKAITMVQKLIREHEYEKAVSLLKGQAKLLSSRREYAQLLKIAEEGKSREAAVKSFFAVADQKEAQKKWMESFTILTQIRLAQPDDPRVEKRYQQTKRRVREWEKERTTKVPEDMLFVPAGYFVMGEAADGKRIRSPRLPVFVDGFYIDRCPVTTERYREFLEKIEKSDDHSRCHPDEPRGKSHRPARMEDPRNKGENLPMVGIDWFDAYAYAAWAGKRLPQEPEWEKAASWKEDEETKLLYPWGNTFDPSRCNSGETGIGRSTPVDRFSNNRSPYGVLDMSGNVWEWMMEWFYNYKYTKRLITNPKGPAYGEAHILRGGAWESGRNGVTTIQRSRAFPLSVFPMVRIPVL